jgi:hypothetical protein
MAIVWVGGRSETSAHPVRRSRGRTPVVDPVRSLDAPLIPAAMVVDALLDARCSAADPQQVEAIDGLLVPIVHRGLLTAEEVSELLVALEEIERGATRSGWRRVRPR